MRSKQLNAQFEVHFFIALALLVIVELDSH